LSANGFLRRDFIRPETLSNPALSEIIARWRKDDWKRIGKKNLRLIRSTDKSGVYFYHAANLYVEKVRSITRERTLARIRKLAKEEKNETARAFLFGILSKKSFYIYYERAGDPQLFSLVDRLRQNLLWASKSLQKSRIKQNENSPAIQSSIRSRR
jgi:hypothetical protein